MSEIIEKKPFKIYKRTSNPENWKQAIRKRLRQSGQEYVASSGKVMAERSVGPGCGPSCRLKCNKRVNGEQRQFIHEMFWRLSDDQKNYFYWKYTTRTTPKKRRREITEAEAPPKKAFSFQYRFEIQSELLQVCSKFFFSTLDITAKRIYYFYEHCYDDDTCMPRSIQRGKNPKPPLPDMGPRLEAIRKHIESFCIAGKGKIKAENGKKPLLPAGFNASKMYKLYVECTPEETVLKRHWYYKVLKEDFSVLRVREPQPKVVKKTIIKKPIIKKEIIKMSSPVPVTVRTSTPSPIAIPVTVIKTEPKITTLTTVTTNKPKILTNVTVLPPGTKKRIINIKPNLPRAKVQKTTIPNQEMPVFEVTIPISMEGVPLAITDLTGEKIPKHRNYRIHSNFTTTT